jgi:hypothetical protein
MVLAVTGDEVAGFMRGITIHVPHW